MITLDASVVIAHLRPADAHHETATGLLRAWAHSGFWMHPLTVAEVLVGGVRTGRGQQLRADLEAMGIQVFGYTAEEPLQLATLRHETGLRLPDCCVLHTARASDTPVASFDTALAGVARALQLSVLPD